MFPKLRYHDNPIFEIVIYCTYKTTAVHLKCILPFFSKGERALFLKSNKRHLPFTYQTCKVLKCSNVMLPWQKTRQIILNLPKTHCFESKFSYDRKKINVHNNSMKDVWRPSDCLSLFEFLKNKPTPMQCWILSSMLYDP